MDDNDRNGRVFRKGHECLRSSILTLVQVLPLSTTFNQEGNEFHGLFILIKPMSARVKILTFYRGSRSYEMPIGCPTGLI